MVDQNQVLDKMTKDLQELIEYSPRSADELEKLSLHSILLVISGYMALGIGTLHFVLSVIGDFRAALIFHLVINVVFGLAILISYSRIKRDLEAKKWAVLSLIFSIVLVTFGGIVGILAGLVALFGGALALLATFDRGLEI